MQNMSKRETERERESERRESHIWFRLSDFLSDKLDLACPRFIPTNRVTRMDGKKHCDSVAQVDNVRCVSGCLKGVWIETENPV